MSNIIVTHGSRGLAKGAQPTVNPLVGKTVFFKQDQDGVTVTVAGLVKSVEGSQASVALAVPTQEGVLFASKSVISVPVHEVTVADATILDREVKSWTDSNPVDSIKAVEVNDSNGNIIDYRDVKFEGFGSTFQGTTAEDRDGDYIMDGAYNDLREFKDNPVMLTDHQRKVNNLMGSYSKVSVTKQGLAVRGDITNSQFPDAIHARTLVAEGHLKTLSVGGLFYYADDYRGVEQIRLYEISLVVIPANPDATFQTRSLDIATAAKAMEFHTKMNGGELRLKG